jgi:hypothetical protein
MLHNLYAIAVDVHTSLLGMLIYTGDDTVIRMHKDFAETRARYWASTLSNIDFDQEIIDTLNNQFQNNMEVMQRMFSAALEDRQPTARQIEAEGRNYFQSLSLELTHLMVQLRDYLTQ